MVRLTRAQCREVDRVAGEKYRVPSIVLMENAARGVVEEVGKMGGGSVVVVCGGGNNGGDGLAVVRHLHNGGREVVVALAVDAEKYVGDARVNWEIVRAMAVRVVSVGDGEFVGRLRGCGLVIDALYGTGLTGKVREGAVIEAMNAAGRPMLAVDIPSGLDCDTGEAMGACVRATKTVTFVAEKVGFGNPRAREFTGEVVVAGIGCPREVVSDVVGRGGIVGEHLDGKDGGGTPR